MTPRAVEFPVADPPQRSAHNHDHGPGRRRGRGEEGYVVIVAMLVLVIVLAVATAAVTQAVQVSSKANRDPLVKAALQAADTGAQTALFRLNSLSQYLSDPSTALPCVESTVDASGNLTGVVLEAALATGWCPASKTESIGNGESFSYQMSPILTIGGNPPDPDGLHFTLDRRIVATGTATGPRGTLTRRVVQTVRALQPSQLFGDDTLLGQTAVNVTSNATVGSATLPAPIRSNHNVTVSLSSGGVQCGPIFYGPVGSGGTFSGTVPACDPAPAPAAVAFPLPTISPPSTNNNTALAAACTLAAPECALSGGNLGNLSLQGSPLAAVLTLSPGSYELCSISLAGSSTLTIADTATSPVIIYIDAPGTNGCVPPSSGAVTISGNSTLVTATGVSPDQFQLLVAGLPGSLSANNTSVSLSGNSTLLAPITIIAPYSNVTVSGTTSLLGGVLGDTVTATGNASLTPYSGLKLPSTGPPPLYQKATYTECTPAPPSGSVAPDAGC